MRQITKNLIIQATGEREMNPQLPINTRDTLELLRTRLQAIRTGRKQHLAQLRQDEAKRFCRERNIKFKCYMAVRGESLKVVDTALCKGIFLSDGFGKFRYAPFFEIEPFNFGEME